jgi:hypothetical protein
MKTTNKTPFNSYQRTAFNDIKSPNDNKNTIVRQYNKDDVRKNLIEYLNGFYLEPKFEKTLAKNEKKQTPAEKKAIVFKNAVLNRLYRLNQPSFGDIPNPDGRSRSTIQKTNAYPQDTLEAIVPIYRGFGRNQGNTEIIESGTQQYEGAIANALGDETNVFHHNIGDRDNSAFISFTTNPEIALAFAGRDGYVAIAHVRNNDVIFSEDTANEDEVLVLKRIRANAVYDAKDVIKNNIFDINETELENAFKKNDEYTKKYSE